MRLLARVASGGTLLVLATVLGLATAAAAFAWINTRSGAKTALDNPDLVVVTREDVPAGTTLPTSVLQLREVPHGQAVTGALDRVELATGRTTRYPLVKGEQVVDSKLVPTDQPKGVGLAFTVPNGMRAVSVPVTEESAAGGLIVPGDRVDVLVSTDYGRLFAPTEASDQNTQQTPTVLTVLQNVMVLAVGQELAQPADAGRDPSTARPANASDQPTAKSVTLAVPPDSAQVLFMASQKGTIGLALRPFGDETETSTTPLLKLQPAVPDNSGLVAAQ